MANQKWGASWSLSGRWELLPLTEMGDTCKGPAERERYLRGFMRSSWECETTFPVAFASMSRWSGRRSGMDENK